jgi:hypothetical protein
MSQKQLNRFAIISKVSDGHMTIAEAAVSLGISQRRIIRLTSCTFSAALHGLIRFYA